MLESKETTKHNGMSHYLPHHNFVINTLLDFIPVIRDLGDREAVRFYNGFRTWKLNYSHLYQRIAGCADYLAEIGLKKGDRVILWGRNEPEWLVTFWASVAKGIIVIPIDPQSPPSFVQKIQKEVQSKLLVHGNLTNSGSFPLDRLTFGEIKELRHMDKLKSITVAPEDVVEIVYTSGTTGVPKGVIHRHNNICANLLPFKKEIDRYRWLASPFQPIRFLNMLPLSHMFGQSAGIFMPILLGGSVVFMNDLHPGTIIETIHNQRVSILVTVPYLADQLRRYVKHQCKLDRHVTKYGKYLETMRRWWTFRNVHSKFGWKFWAVVLGGAEVKSKTELFWSKLGFLVIQGYGLTESSPIVAVNHPFRVKHGSLGQIIEGQEIKIAADGEILVRGNSIATNYFSKGTVQNITSKEGWLRTGDIGEIDEEKRLYYKGRKKDVIVTSTGLNVYPRDVEDILNQFLVIKQSAVVGSEKDGREAIHAVLILRESSSDVDQIIRRANQKLQPHQRIQRWSVWPDEDFPKTTSTMKLKRDQIANRIKVELGTDKTRKKIHRGQLPTNLEVLLAEISEIKPDQLSEDTHLSADLGFSSLDRVELLSRLQDRYSIDLDEQTFGEISTIGEMRELIKEAELGCSKSFQSRNGKRTDTTLLEPRWPRGILMSSARLLFQHVLVLPLFRYYIPFSVSGRRLLKTLQPPVIFAANHCSHLDTVAILAALPFWWRIRLAPAVRSEYFMTPLQHSDVTWKKHLSVLAQYYLTCGLFNAYFLPQKMGGIHSALKYSGELVEKKYCPLVFPEGLRSPNAQIQPFRDGVALLAIRLGVPVVPIHIRGTFEVLSVHDDWPRRRPVQLTIGTPLNFHPGEKYKLATRKIEAEIKKMSEFLDKD